MKAQIITLIAKVIGKHIKESEHLEVIFEILTGVSSDKELEEIKKFFQAGRSATERILSRESMMAANIPESEVDFVIEEINFLLSKIKITDEVLVENKYNSMELEDFLWYTYCGLKGKNSDIECGKSIKEGLFAVARVWIQLEFEDPDFEKKSIARIEVKLNYIISIIENMQSDINQLKDINNERDKTDGRGDENPGGQRKDSTERTLENAPEKDSSDGAEDLPDEIKIYLAAAQDEFQKDVDSLKEFIEEQNSCQKAVRLTLQCNDREEGLDICEYKYCYILIGNKAEKRIWETYELAYSFNPDELAGAMKLRLYCKNLPDGTIQEDGERNRLEDRYKKDFKRAPYYFSSIDRIKLDILQNLREEVPDAGFSAKSILQFQNNEAYKKAVEELDLTQSKYEEAVACAQSGSRKSEENIALLEKELEERKETVKKLEEDIWSNISLLSDKLQDKTKMDAREVKAIESVIESGDYKNASAILYDAGWKQDIDDLEQAMENKKEVLKLYISSQRTLISSLKATGTSGTEDKIIEIYERITAISKKWGIEYVTLYEYAEFLFNQQKYDSGIKTGEYLRCLYDICDSVPADDRARLLKLLGNLYFSNENRKNNYAISERNYREALQILSPKSNRNLKLLTEIHNDLAKLFWKTNQPKKAEGILHDNVDYLKSLVETEPKVYEPVLAFAYNYTASLASRRNQLDEAIEYHHKAMEIRKRLAKKSSFYNMQAERELSATYNNIGFVYRKMRDFPNTDKYYKESIKIRERNIKRNRSVYEPSLALAYSEYAVFLNIKNENEEAQIYCQKALDIRDALAEKNPSYNAELSNTLYEYGIIMKDAHDYDQAEKYITKAIEIREKLVKKDRIRYRLDLAEAYHSYGRLLIRMGNSSGDTGCYEGARENFNSAIKIFREFVGENPGYDEEKIAEAYKSLAFLLEQHFQEYPEAKEYYCKAIKKWEQLAQRCPQVYEPKLKETEEALAKLQARS